MPRILAAFIFALSIAGQAQELPTSVVKASEIFNSQVRPIAYNYNSELFVTGDPEAITGKGFKNNELRRILMQTGAFYSYELGTVERLENGEFFRTIEAAQMKGFKQLVYAIYNIEFQSPSMLAHPYVIYDEEYDHPLSEKGLVKYRFSTLQDSTSSGKTLSQIRFEHTELPVFGELLIDSSGKLAGMNFKTADGVITIATHSANFDEESNSWVETERSLYIESQKQFKQLEFLGGRAVVGVESAPDEKSRVFFLLKAKNDKHTFNGNFPEIPKGLTTVIKDDADRSAAAFNSEIKMPEQIRQVDSIIQASRIDRRLKIIEKFKVGYFPIYFLDIDLKYLIKYNNFEAFRVGLGGVTNDRLSEKFRLNGYLAYGTRDQAWKYRGGGTVLLDKNTSTWLGAYKTEDIAEIASAAFLTDARVYSLFEPRLINIPTYYIYNEYGVNLQHRPLPVLLGEFSLSRKRIEQTTPYRFIEDGVIFQNYFLAEAVVGARYSPRSRYLKSSAGIQEISTGFPVFSAQFTKGIPDFLGSDFQYVKLSAKAYYEKNHQKGAQTSIQVEGHYAFGDVPLTHLYHAYPNAPTRDEVLQRFSVAGRGSFETMFFNEFFSDQLLTSQVRHSFDRWKIANWLQPQFVLLQKFAIGDMRQPEQHEGIDFTTLEHGFHESGFEINQIFWGFGLAAAYRYGAYHLPEWSDNLAIKFTFYLEL